MQGDLEDRRTKKEAPVAGSAPAGEGALEHPRLTRRGFLASVGAGAALATAGALPGCGSSQASEPPDAEEGRRELSRTIRRQAADMAYERGASEPVHNGERDDYPFLGSFTKGFPHNERGEVDDSAYRLLVSALASGAKEDFESLPLAGDRPLRNPLAGKAFDLEGPDSHSVVIRPAPRLDGAESSAELAEVYWMALLRDVGFVSYGESPAVEAAAADLSRFSELRAPKQGGSVTPATLFRGDTPGDLAGPYVSQFLFRDIPYGSLTISQRQRTTLPGIDYMSDYASWLSVKRGFSPSIAPAHDPVPRYIRNGRDLAAYVHVDALYQAYLNACLILIGMGAPLNPGNPYLAFTKMDAFATFGDPHILTLVTEVATRALKAVWYQKWYIHLRNRPEEAGGSLHAHLSGLANHPIGPEIFDCEAVHQAYDRFGTYLLPQAYPEGSPMHPSYGAGHATVAGACVTVLKAWFDETYVLPETVVPNEEGTELVTYTGSDAHALTVGGELDKLAANVATARNFAGIHWRSDYSESIRLGERVAIGILQEQKLTYGEEHSLTFTSFDGAPITV